MNGIMRTKRQTVVNGVVCRMTCVVVMTKVRIEIMDKVIIEVRKGCAVCVSKPDDVVVEVKDYDIENGGEMVKDQAGKNHYRVVYN